MKLKEIILAKNMPLGNTPSGSDWCIKALHPADPLTEVRGLPDRSSIPSVMMNYQTTTTIKPPTGMNVNDKWQFDMQLLPHPVQFAWTTTQDASETHFGGDDILNAQLEGATHGDKYNSLISSFKRWRLAYMSVTIYQDGPDLANQGTIVVCQKPLTARELDFSCPGITSTGSPLFIPGMNFTRGLPKVRVYTVDDAPNFEASQGMPSAYFSKSRDGAYVPLKLTETCQQWQSAETSSFYFLETSGTADRAYVGNGTGITWPAVASGSEPSTGYPFHTTKAPSIVFDMARSQKDDARTIVKGMTPEECQKLGMISSGYTWNGDVSSAMLNDVVADICARNLSAQTSFSLFFRVGLEVQVAPSSVMAPHQKLSPPYDPAALDTYHAISRELKDAFPADYNSLGKIWDAISSAMKFASPLLSAIPGVGPLLSTGLGGISSAGDAIKAAVAKHQAPKDLNIQAVNDVSDALAAKGLVLKQRPRSARPKPKQQRKNGAPNRNK